MLKHTSISVGSALAITFIISGLPSVHFFVSLLALPIILGFISTTWSFVSGLAITFTDGLKIGSITVITFTAIAFIGLIMLLSTPLDELVFSSVGLIAVFIVPGIFGVMMASALKPKQPMLYIGLRNMGAITLLLIVSLGASIVDKNFIYLLFFPILFIVLPITGFVVAQRSRRNFGVGKWRSIREGAMAGALVAIVPTIIYTISVMTIMCLDGGNCEFTELSFTDLQLIYISLFIYSAFFAVIAGAGALASLGFSSNNTATDI